MDCPANHRYRYHNYAPSPRFLGKEWKGQNHEARLPGGHRGRHQRGRRGAGNMAKPMNREDLYQSYPSHALLRGRVNSQQQKNSPPSWHPGTSVSNENELSSTTESQQVDKNVTVSVKSSSSLAKLTNNRAQAQKDGQTTSTSTSDNPPLEKKSENKNPSINKVAPFIHKPSPNSSKFIDGTNSSSLTLNNPTSETASEVKHEDQVKLHCGTEVPPMNVTVSSVSQIMTSTPPCLASQDGMMTVFAPTSDGQMKPIIRTICSCQLKKRSLKYADKGKTKNDSIIIDSDEEGDNKSKAASGSVNEQDVRVPPESCPLMKDASSEMDQLSCQDTPKKRAKMSTDCASVNNLSLHNQSASLVSTQSSSPGCPVTESISETASRVGDSIQRMNNGAARVPPESCPHMKDSTSEVDQPSCQDSTRKRAKMSTDSASGDSLSLHNQSAPVSTQASSPSCPAKESITETVSRVIDSLGHSLGDVCSSSTSSDSLSLVTANLTDNGQLLGDPQILRGILSVCKETARPLKKFKSSPRNLYTAAKDCNIQKVIALLVAGCDPNQQLMKAKGKTALHAAAAGGYVDIIACLRLAGCDLNLVDYENRTPIFDAVSNHKVKAIEYLIDCGAVLGTKDTKGMTCLHLAARQGHPDLIKLLLNTGKFDMNEKDDGGWTPIMWAAEDKHRDATQLLIEQGANVHIRDEELNTPLHWAALSGNLEVCRLLLEAHADINSLNIFKETSLHIAAREDCYNCVQLLVSRGANIYIKNKDGQTPLTVAKPDTKSKNLLHSKVELESCQEFIRPRILHSDISRGQENVSISCINEVDDVPFPDFTFVKESFEIYNGTINWSISKFEGCACDGDCRSGRACRCSERSERQRIWYNEEGLLKGDLQKYDRPLVFECNRMCNCWSYCRNRVVQKGMQYPLQLYRTYRKGWGVRSLAEIPQGSFVCEYTGELISDTEADARDDDDYLFDLDCKENAHELFCIDAKHYGNISRFINHSCEPNVFPIRVFIHHRDVRFPRIAFFATKEINVHDEICFNYGDRFWSVKRKEFFCECDTPSCKYRDRNR